MKKILLVGFLLFPAIVFAASANIHEKYGLPSSENVIKKSTYIVSFNNDFKIPNWTAYQLTKSELATKRKRTGSFKPDSDYPTQFQAKKSDYSGSGYDQGHLTPSADMVRSLLAMTGTFVYTNCAPQVGKGFNQGIWRLLEEKAREWAENKNEIWIYTGVYTVPDEDDYIYYIGDEIIIPTHWYKIIYAPNGPSADDDELISFLMENKKYPNNNFMQYVTSVDEIEKLTGMDFLNTLSNATQRRIEKEKKVGDWN